jgi:quinol monooxygenase YgiN
MFIHAVLFEVRPKEVAKYRRDSLLWASFARKAKGFVAYRTMRRCGCPHQYASVYEWKEKACHDRFMRKFHDWLVGKSKARVKVLGYYNLAAIDNI